MQKTKKRSLFLAHHHASSISMFFEKMDECLAKVVKCCFFLDEQKRRPVQRVSVLLCRRAALAHESEIETSRLQSKSPDALERSVILITSLVFDHVSGWSARDWLDALDEMKLKERIWASLFIVEDLVVKAFDEAVFSLHFELRCQFPVLSEVAPVLICSRTKGDFVRWSTQNHKLFPVEFRKIVEAVFAAYYHGNLRVLLKDLIRHICSFLPMFWPTPCCGWFHDRKCRGGYVSNVGASVECNSVLEKYPFDWRVIDDSWADEAVCRYHFDRGFFEPLSSRGRQWYHDTVVRGLGFAPKFLWFSILWLAPYAADGAIIRDNSDADSSSSGLASDVVENNVGSLERSFVPEMLVSEKGTNRFGRVLDVVAGNDAAVEVCFFDSETALMRPEQLVFVPPTSVGEEVFSKRGNRAVVLLIRMKQVIIKFDHGLEVEDVIGERSSVRIVPISELCLIAKSWHKRLKV